MKSPFKSAHWPDASAPLACDVCPRHCRLQDGQVGQCGVRRRAGDVIAPIGGQRWAATGVQAVEAHPMFHFNPGLRTLCLGAAGCSARCGFCQNWELAITPRHRPLVDAAGPATTDLLARAIAQGCGAVSFTYSEATVWPEGVAEVAGAARALGLRVILATNGYLSASTFQALGPLIDAVKIDLKGPTEASCQELAEISLDPVLETLRRFRAAGTWCEISTVLVPGILDTRQAIDGFARLIIEQAGSQTPWHLQRFFPAYRMLGRPPGDIASLRRARTQARSAGLEHVYISNIPGIAERNTDCGRCGLTLVDRSQGAPPMATRNCPRCGATLPGHWDTAGRIQEVA